MTRLALVSTLALAALAGLRAPRRPTCQRRCRTARSSSRAAATTRRHRLSNVQAQIWTDRRPGRSRARRTANALPAITGTRRGRQTTRRSPTRRADGDLRRSLGHLGSRRDPADLAVDPRNITTLDAVRGPARVVAGRHADRLRRATRPDLLEREHRARRRRDGRETLVANVALEPDASSFFPRPHWTPDSPDDLLREVHRDANHDIYRAPADGSDSDGHRRDHRARPTTTSRACRPTARSCASPARCRQQGRVHLLVAGGIPAALLPTTSTGRVRVRLVAGPDDGARSSAGRWTAGQMLMRNSERPWTGRTRGRRTGRHERSRSTATRTGHEPVAHVRQRPGERRRNSVVPIPLSCADVPEPSSSQPEEVELQIVTPPTNGALGGLDDNAGSSTRRT